MALSDSSVLDRVLLYMGVGGVTHYRVYNGDHTDSSNELSSERGSANDFVRTTNANRNQLIARVEAGTCDIYYSFGGVIWADEDLPDMLQSFRWAHPLHSGTGWQLPRHLIDEGAVSVDIETGQPTYQFKGSFGTARRTPDGDTYNQPLSAFIAAAQSQANQFALQINLSASDGWTTSNINNHPPIAAMLAHLEAQRHNNVALGDDLLSIGLAAREFRIDQTDTQVLHFNCQQVNVGYSGTNIIRVRLICNRLTSGVAYNIGHLNTYLSTHTGTIDVSDDIEPTVLGRAGVPILCSELWFQNSDDGTIYKVVPRSDNLIYYGHDPLLDEAYELPMMGDYGRTVDYDDLEDHYDSEDPPAVDGKTLPVYGTYDTIHFGPGEAASGNVHVQEPQDAVVSPKVHRVLHLHNRHGDSYRRVDFTDWDNETFVRMQPGEYGSVQVTRDDEGGGEMIGRDINERVNLISSGEVMPDLELGDVPYWTYSSNERQRQFPTPAQIYNSGDAFEVGSATIASGDNWQSDINTGTHAEKEARVFSSAAVKMKMRGLIRINMDVEIQLGSGDGVLTANNRVGIYRLRDGSFTQIPGSVVYDEISGANSRHNFIVATEDIVEVGDVIFPFLRYYTTSTLNFATTDVVNFHRSMILRPEIAVSA